MKNVITVEKVGTSKARVLGMRLATASLLALPGLAGAQTAGTTNGGFASVGDGTNAVGSLGLEQMIGAAGAAIKALISNNSGPLIIALIPILGFFFIWGRIRSLF